ncbi:MAG: flagellar hook-associated protein FlgL [Succinivibrio sp.]|nr:flagellar hook-associated protein FlgL [Succinivibrio sp.]
MRISTTMQYRNNLRYLQNANSTVDEASNRINSGRKFETAGEDPSGMSAKIKYEGAIASYNQYAKSAGLAADCIAEEELALQNIWNRLNSVHTRLIQAVDGSNDESSIDALAEEIDQVKTQIFDLMNTQNSDGEYIFSGAQSAIPTYSISSTGQYTCQADGSVRSVQVSPKVTIQTSDSGLNVFENCDVARSFTSTVEDGDAIAYSMVSNYGDFNDLYDKYFSDYSTGTSQNALYVVIDDGTYTVYDGDPTDTATTVLGTGEVDADNDVVVFKGMEFGLPDETYSGTIKVTLDDPVKDNILNQLNEVTEAMRSGLSSQELSSALAKAQVSVKNAMDHVDLYRGRVGARQVNIDAVLAIDNSLAQIKTESKTNITEVDLFEATTNLTLGNQALQVARATYSKVHGASLFDYI